MSLGRRWGQTTQDLRPQQRFKSWPQEVWGASAGLSQKSSTTELALERSHMENAMWAPGGTWALLQPSERGGWSGEVQVPSWHPVCCVPGTRLQR